MLKVLSTFFNLSISDLSTLDFKLAKSTVLANCDVPTPVAFFKSAFVAWLDKSNSTVAFPLKDFGSGNYSFIYIMSFLSIQLLKEPFNT